MTTTWHRKGILPALPKQPAEMYLSPFLRSEDGSNSLRCLEPVDTLPSAWSDGQLRIARVPPPPVSVTVLRLSAP